MSHDLRRCNKVLAVAGGENGAVRVNWFMHFVKKINNGCARRADEEVEV